MTDDQVFKQRFQFRRKIGNHGKLGLQHLKLDDHVPEKLSASGVGERPVVSELVNLAHIVKKRSRQNEIPVHLRIVSTNQIARATQRYNVIQQTTNVSVVQGLGRRSIAVGLCDLRVGHERLNQRPEVRILEACDKRREGLPKLVDILGGFREIVGKIYLRFPQLP